MVGRIVAEHAGEFAQYPPNEGTPELRAAIAGWLRAPLRREHRSRRPQIIAAERHPRGPVQRRAGAVARRPRAARGRLVLMPNPFYQAYGAAALAAGAEPVPVPATAETGFLPDYAALPPALLDRVTLCYLCSPSNPQGAVADAGYLARLIALAERHDFRILADECYAEIYRDTAAARRPGGGRGGRRRSRAGAGVQLALEAVERPGPALGLRRRRAALDRGAAPAPRLWRRAAAAAAAARRGRALAATRRMSRRAGRSTARSSRWPTGCSAACPAMPRRRPASSSGCASATARRRRSGSGARPACGCCPAAISAAPTATAATRARTTSASRWSPDAAEVERGLDGRSARRSAQAVTRGKGRLDGDAPRKRNRRAPLMESDTEVALRRRGSELIGIVLLGVAGCSPRR